MHLIMRRKNNNNKYFHSVEAKKEDDDISVKMYLYRVSPHLNEYET